MEKKNRRCSFWNILFKQASKYSASRFVAPTQTRDFERNITKFILQPIKEEKPKWKEDYFSERIMIQNGTIHDFMKHQLRC